AAAAIDLALVEDGIEFGKKMMAEMIATYSAPGTSPGVVTTAREPAFPSAAVSDVVDPLTGAPPAPAQEAPAGGGYLNEVRALSATPHQGGSVREGRMRQDVGVPLLPHRRRGAS